MRKLGPVLVLVAMVGFAVSALTLDFYSTRSAPSELDLAYFDLLSGQGRAPGLAVAGAVLVTFGAPMLIVILDLMVLAGRRPGAARHGLVAAIATWAVITLGSALNIRGLATFPVGVGFWAQVVCAGLAIAGALLMMSAAADERLGKGTAHPPETPS